MPPDPLIGVVGGVGSGKSAVASGVGAAWGLPVLDGDAAGHAALRDPGVKTALRGHFGDAVFDGDQVSRGALAGRVFGDAPERRAALAALQDAVHPVIRAALLGSAADAFAAGAPAVLLDAAVLLETGYRGDCWRVLFVDAPRPVRLVRVAARGWDPAELDRREASQWPLDRKRAASDGAVGNGGSLDAAVRDACALLSSWGLAPAADSPAASRPTAVGAPR